MTRRLSLWLLLRVEDIRLLALHPATLRRHRPLPNLTLTLTLLFLPNLTLILTLTLLFLSNLTLTLI